MLTLFKGQLSINDIMYRLPYKELIEMKHIREERLIKEQKELEQMEQAQEHEEIRNRILQP